jgi:hypothetical protein
MRLRHLLRELVLLPVAGPVVADRGELDRIGTVRKGRRLRDERGGGQRNNQKSDR